MTDDLKLAIDIGGTFTDGAVMTDGRMLGTAKALTTHDDPVRGSLDAAAQALAVSGRTIGEVSTFIHGTTLATNALIEKRGARTACILTHGFRDILEIAYERRYDQYDLQIEKPEVLVPRSRCLTIRQRHDAAGRELQPIDEAALPQLLDDLDASGADAVAICLLHAYANPTHERRLATLIGSARPGLFISLSSDVSPEAREFDRLSTTVANAYVRPLMAGYLDRFQAAFAAQGLTAPVLMMTAGGGMTTLNTAAKLPIRLVESGPAGGAILAARLATSLGLENVLSFDMGGTTAKLCLIDNGRPQTARHFEIARAARFTKGSGMPVRVPVIEMIEIGAGGGSIAAVDSLGRVQVGPESAGSTPGPAAFCRGGTRPTVTDADVVLGLIDPAGFADRSLLADRGAADEAIADIAQTMGITASEAAEGIAEIVDEAMASAARIHAAEAGKDLASRTLIAFGGNGPLHATRVAEKAGVRRIIVPPVPSVGSAVGFLSATVAFETTRSLYTRLDAPDLDVVNSALRAMEEEASAVVAQGAPGPYQIRRITYMRYRGQGHEIGVSVPDGDLGPPEIYTLTNAFHQEYARIFSRAVPGMIVECLNWSVTVSARKTSAQPVLAASAEPEPPSMRSILIDGLAHDVPVYRRSALLSLAKIQGPALIAEAQTTTLVSPGWTAHADTQGILHLERIAP